MAVTVKKRAISQLFVADCASANIVGDIVRVSADAVGGVYQTSSLDINYGSVQLAFGIIIQKITSTRCIVQTGGEVVGVYTGLTPGGPLFINGSSRLTHTVPAHPAAGVRWSYFVAQALSSDALLLRVQRPIKIRA